MSTVYISIGTPKTGTTALQSFMRENSAVMEKQGYCYPKMDLTISDLYKNRNAQFLVYRSRKEGEEAKKAHVEKVRREAYRQLGELAKIHPNIILSEEQIWYRCNQIEHFWPELLENFKNIGCQVKIIVYLRRQDQVIQSLWNQLVKMLRRTTRTFEECIASNEFDYFPLDYYSQVQEIAKYVGKENLIIRMYEKGQFLKDSIFEDFFHCVGLKLTEEFTNNNVAKNMGLDGNYIEIKRILNGVPEYRTMNDFMFRPILNASIHASSKEKGPKSSMFSYEEQKKFMAKYDEGNRKLAQEYLGREDGVMFYEQVKEVPKWTLNQESICRDMLLVLGEVFCNQEQKLCELEAEMRAEQEGTEAINRNILVRIGRRLMRLFDKNISVCRGVS